MDVIKIEPPKVQREEYRYFIEKSSALLHKLLIGEGNAKQRLLENAFELNYLLVFNLPNKVKSKQKKLIGKLTKKGDFTINNEIYTPAIIRTLRSIHKSTASKIINEFNSLFDEVRTHQDSLYEIRHKKLEKPNKKDKIKIIVQYSPKP